MPRRGSARSQWSAGLGSVTQRRRRILVTIAAIAITSMLAATFSPGSAAGRAGGDAAVTRTLANALRVPVSDLTIESRTTATYPVLGRSATIYKATDRANGTTSLIGLTPTGRAVDPADLLAAEIAATRQSYGKLAPSLYDASKGAQPSEHFDIIVWVDALIDGAGQPRAEAAGQAHAGRGDLRAAREELARADAKASATTDSAAAPVRAALQRMGAPFRSVSGLPIITASVTARQITALQRLPAVEAVELEPETALTSAIVHTTTGFSVTDNRGITGTGVSLAQVEVGGYVDPNNAFLRNNVVMDGNASLCAPNNHAAVVAGVIHYHASSSSILATGDCGGRTAYLFERTRAAITWGASAVNHSWAELCRKDGVLTGNVNGAHTSLDKTLDTITYSRRRLQIVAAGNDGHDPSCQYVEEPAGGWNVLTVGNFDDRNTNTWSDDSMYATSSWRDPYSTNGDMEKPEVAAPGTNIANSAIDSGNWVGTSFAAPVYTALAGDLIQRAPSLASRPEALKAVLMASSVHNVEGASRISEYDGVGGPWAAYADDVAKGIYVGTTDYKKSWWYSRGYDCSAVATNLNYYAYFEANKRARITVAWSTNPNYQFYEYQPSADLDLRVYNYSTGVLQKSSLSYDNAWEIVDFSPSTSGFYTIQIRKDRCDLSPAGLGVAWWQAP